MSSKLSTGIAKTAGFGSTLLRGAGKAVAAPFRLAGRAIGLGTTEGKINAALTSAGALAEGSGYKEKFERARR